MSTSAKVQALHAEMLTLSLEDLLFMVQKAIETNVEPKKIALIMRYLELKIAAYRLENA